MELSRGESAWCGRAVTYMQWYENRGHARGAKWERQGFGTSVAVGIAPRWRYGF